MCCQFHVSPEVEALLKEKSNEGAIIHTGLMKPSSTTTLLTPTGISNMTWGFRSPRDNSLLINARSESVLEKPTFRESFLERRCIIPASVFYEYHHKEKVSFSLEESPILFMAGIYTTDSGILRFTILTTSANSSVSPYHDRMPLLLTLAHTEDYLYSRKDAERLLSLPQPELAARPESKQLEFLF